MYKLSVTMSAILWKKYLYLKTFQGVYDMKYISSILFDINLYGCYVFFLYIRIGPIEVIVPYVMR